MQKKKVTFTKRVFLAMGFGILIGGFIQIVYGISSKVTDQTLDWYNIVGTGYMQLLQMIVMPLILVSIIVSFTKMQKSNKIGKIGIRVLGVLLGTTAIAAILGIITAFAFGLNGKDFVSGSVAPVHDAELESGIKTVQHVTFPQQLLSLLPANPFADLTGSRDTSTIAIVIFAVIVGIAFLSVKRSHEKQADLFVKMLDAVYAVIMRIVDIVIELTPFGVLGLMANMMATSDFGIITDLGKYVIAIYAAVFVMFIIHLLFLSFAKLNPFLYIKKAMPAFIMGFTSRSIASALPLSVKAQTEKMGVPEGTANFAATLGISIGQNGCAGIFPAVLVIMSAPLAGVDPLSLKFLISVVVVVVIGSLGVSGMGGGAQFAALIDLTMLNLPITLVGLLLAVDPIIDMIRTSLNVSDGMLAGIFASRATGDLDKDVFNSSEEAIKEVHV